MPQRYSLQEANYAPCWRTATFQVPRNLCNAQHETSLSQTMEHPEGIEPTLTRLQRVALATWLRVPGSGGRIRTAVTGSKDPRPATGRHLIKRGRGGWDRTSDHSVPNRVRYHCATPRVNRKFAGTAGPSHREFAGTSEPLSLKTSGRWESNPPGAAWKADASPVMLRPHEHALTIQLSAVQGVGFEPT